MSTPYSQSQSESTQGTSHDESASSGTARAAVAVAASASATVAATVEATVEAAVDLLYRAQLWLPNRHVQTIVPSLFARRPAVSFKRERWDTPDGDFIDLDWVVHDGRTPNGAGNIANAASQAPHVPAEDAPLFVLFHGLEGSSSSHYAAALMAAALDHGMAGIAWCHTFAVAADR